VAVGGRTTGFELTKTAELYLNGSWKSVYISNTHDGAFSVRLPDGRYMVGGGSVSDGVTFTKLVEKRVNNNIVKPTQYFDYVANGSNKALIILEFKAVGKVASSRGLDAVEPAGDGGVETIHW